MPAMPLHTKYKLVYFQELKKVSDDLRERILKSVGNDAYKDKEVEQWIKDVTLLAEVSHEKECETEAEILKNKNKPKLDAPKRP